MKRAIVVSVRTSKDNKTGEDTAWITVAIMPTKMSNGNLFYPQSKNIAVSTCAGAVRFPDKFSKYKSFNIGDLVDVHYALNEFNQTPMVVDIVLVEKCPYKANDLIV